MPRFLVQRPPRNFAPASCILCRLLPPPRFRAPYVPGFLPPATGLSFSLRSSFPAPWAPRHPRTASPLPAPSASGPTLFLPSSAFFARWAIFPLVSIPRLLFLPFLPLFIRASPHSIHLSCFFFLSGASLPLALLPFFPFPPFLTARFSHAMSTLPFPHSIRPVSPALCPRRALLSRRPRFACFYLPGNVVCYAGIKSFFMRYFACISY